MVDAEGNFDAALWQGPTLDLENRRLGASLAPFLAQGLRITTTVRYLNLKGNALGDDGVQVVMEAMRGNRTVEILDLSDNAIKDSGGLAVGAMLEGNATLQSLCLAGNRIRKTGVAAIANALTANSRLKKLDLSDNRLRDGGVAVVADALRRNQTLLQLNVARNEVNVAGGRALASMLTANGTLQALNVGYNLLGEALVDFAPALSVNVSLMELDLEANLFTPEHAKRFGEALLKVGLMAINLSRNPLGDDGLRPVLEGFKALSALRYVDLSSVGLTARCVGDVADLVRLSPQLERLHVDGNAIGSEGVTMLAAAMKEHQHLMSLNVSHCNMDSSAAVALSLALNNNLYFSSLVVADNRISDEGCRTLCYALKRLTRLRTLDLTANAVTAAMQEELASVFVNNAELTSVTLVGNPIASLFANGILSRRIALQLLGNMADSSTVVAAPHPLPATPGTFRRTLTRSAGTAGPSPTAVLRATEWVSPATASGASPVKTALVQLAMSGNTLAPSGATELAAQFAGLSAADEFDPSAYRSFVPPKSSLEHPLYGGFGRGRLTNRALIQVPGEVVPYTMRNSWGPKPVQKWADSISTADAMFATAPRWPPPAHPYLEQHLERNVGGLLVTERQLRDAFNELDADGQGWIDRAQFERLYGSLENFGVQTSQKRLCSSLDRYRIGDSGRLSFDEFCILMLTVAQR